MKKILSLILVLAIGSVASAGSAWLEVDPQDAAESYAGSSIITINLVADSDVTGIALSIGTDLGGTASDPRVLHPAMVTTPYLGNLVNAGGVLISGITGGTAYGAPGVPAGLVLYSFEFHVPDGLEPSTIITIDDITDYSASPPMYTMISFEDYTMDSDVDGVEIHVPEPATIALLGFGALSLLRRRRKA